MDKELGASAAQTGLSPSVEPASAVSPADAASIPSAWRRTFQMDWSIESGIVTFIYPGDMSHDDIADTKELLEVAFAGMIRRAQAIEAAQGPAE